LLLAIFSRNVTLFKQRRIQPWALALGIIGNFSVLCVSDLLRNCWQAFIQTLQLPNRELHPKKEDVIQVLQIGLIVGLIGLLVAFNI